MTQQQKADILKGLELLLDGMVDEQADILPEKCRMLTIRECAMEAEGLSEHTIRLLIKRGEIPAIRAGEGKSGKLLVPQAALMKYLSSIVG